MPDLLDMDARSTGAADIDQAIRAVDFFRGSPRGLGEAATYKEWQHFAIHAPELDLLVNFSVCDDARSGARTHGVVPRIVLVVRDEDGWDGDVDTFDEAEARMARGRTNLVYGESSLVFGDGAFEIDAVLRERPIRVRLRLRPVTLPVLVPSVPMIDGPPLHWSVVPRLEVSGTVQTRRRTHRLERALAYHDHNWGHFLWGHDVAWEWGFVLPDDPAVPWTLTFVRLTNRARTVALSHRLLLWRRERLVRTFLERDLAVETPLAYRDEPVVFKVPRPMALVAPETAIDVPEGLDTQGRIGSDWIRCTCAVDDVAQVLIPSETRLGVTIFNEATARTSVRGRVGGEAFDYAGRSVLEFIRVA